jgi:hypothetical protein
LKERRRAEWTEGQRAQRIKPGFRDKEEVVEDTQRGEKRGKSEERKEAQTFDVSAWRLKN